MTDPTDENNENGEETQEQCSHDGENGRNPYQVRYRTSTWMPSQHTHILTADGDDIEELLESIPEERLDDLIYVEPSDNPECPAYNALKPIRKRVRKDVDATPHEERNALQRLRDGSQLTDENIRGPHSDADSDIADMLSEARRQAWFMGKAAKGKSLPPMHGGVTINPKDTLTAFEMLGSIESEARKYRQERIKEEFGSVPEYMQAVIEDLEELARTAPHHPPHQLTVGSMRNSTPVFYPYRIKHPRARGDSVDPLQDAIDLLSENEDEDDE